MMKDETKGIKQISQGKYLFFINGKEIYYITFESKDMKNIEIILIKLNPKETYVYKTIIPFQQIGTNDTSVIETLYNLNFIIYNFDFSITDEFNKIILSLNSKSKASIELFLYNKNMENDKNNGSKKKIEMRNNLEKMQDEMKDLINIIEKQNKKILELKQKEESQIKLINKVDEVTKQIANEYKEIKNKNFYNSSNNNFNQNNNYNNQNNNNAINNNNNMQTRNNYNQNNSNNLNVNFNQNKKLSVNVNYILNPYLPDNTNINNLLTRPQNMYPVPQQQEQFQKYRSVNLDEIPDYRHNN